MKLIRQGHLYDHGGRRVIALATGASAPVREIDPSEPLGLGNRYWAIARWLTPLPMKYFHGQVPRNG